MEQHRATLLESLGQQLPVSLHQNLSDTHTHSLSLRSFFCTLFWYVHEPRAAGDRVNGFGMGGSGWAGQSYT